MCAPKFIRIALLGSVIFFLIQSSIAATIKTPSPVSGHNPSSIQHVIPADVLARVKLLSGEVDLIREALGKPKEHQSIISVSNAQPREVYFEAQALFQKANRLAYEVTGSHEEEPEIHSQQLKPAHVWQLVDSALKRVLLVKQHLKIQKKIQEQKEPNTVTPSNVFNAILQANQELNGLLYHRVAPSDVFQQLTLAVNDVANLLKYFNVSPRIPDAPNFIAKKTPTDVYQRLIHCIKLLENIAKKSKIKILHVHIDDLGTYQVTPNNVFDLSKIIVSEVRYLNTLLPYSVSIQAFYPGYKMPSEVYQRAGILLKQLELLESAVDKNPNWLKEIELKK